MSRQSASVATLALLLTALGAASFLVFTLDPHRAPVGVTLLDHAESVEFVTLETGEHLTSLRDVALSQDWRLHVPMEGRAPSGLVNGHYRITFLEDDVPDGPRAILIPRVSRTVELTLNGTRFYSEAQQDPEQSWEWYTPRLIPLPEGLIRQGENVLDVSVTASFQSTAGLSRLLLGPVASVTAIHDRLGFLKAQLPLAANLATLVMAVPLLLVWVNGVTSTSHHHFAPYGLLAAAMIIFALRSMHVHVDAVPISMDIWLPLVSSSLAWAVGFFSIFLLRRAGLVNRLPEKLIIGAILAGTAILFLFPDGSFARNRTLYFYVPMALVGVACIAFVCAKSVVRPDQDRVLLSLALLMIVPPTIHDLAWLRGALPFETILWLPVAMPAVMLAISATVANGYARAWVRAHEANAELNRQIDAARQDLRQSYEARLVAERGETVARERAQLIEDLHDGVGNRLSILLATFRARELPGQQSLQDCLNDLRMVMTARDVGTVGEALADMCHLNHGAAEALGTELSLDCAAGAQDLRLPPREMLNTLRIGQEALSNALRHSGSRTITVQAWLDDERKLRLRIRDSGSDPARPPGGSWLTGRGMETMRARAARLGGELSITRSDHGWTVEFVLPVAKYLQAVETTPDTPPPTAPAQWRAHAEGCDDLQGSYRRG